MRILVHEFVSGGGLAGRDVPASLGREGLAMLTALVADLAAIRRHQIVTTVDPRFPLPTPPGVEVVTLSPGSDGSVTLDALIASADAVWLVAPETDRCLERLAARVERKGRTLLGSGATAIRRASDKARLPRRLARHRRPTSEDARPPAWCGLGESCSRGRLSADRQARTRSGLRRRVPGAQPTRVARCP